MRVLRPHRLLTGAALVLLLTVGAGCGGGSGEATTKAGEIPGAKALPPEMLGTPAPLIELPNARGGSFDTSSLKGKPYGVTFLYTQCPDVCPLIAEQLRDAVEGLGPRADEVAIVAVSVDPKGDTAEQVRRWLRLHRAPPNFHYLIGSEAQLEPVWKAWYAAPQIRGDPESAHTATTWLIDGHGKIAGKVSPGIPIEPAELTQAFETLLKRQ